MDEKGFMQGVIAKQKVVVSRNEHFKGKSFITQCGNREWTSLIKCVSTDGRVLSPWVIFKGVQCKKEWMKNIVAYNPLSHITMSHNGWTDNTIGLEWFTKCFIPETAVTLHSEYRLMVFDGHASHISSNVIRLCVANKIVLLYLPPHTTHLLQPLDIGLFAPLAVHYKSTIRDTCKFGYNFSVDKLVFLDCYYKACNKAFTVTNIQKAWKKSGLHPFLPSLIIDQMLALPLPVLPASGTSSHPSSRPTTSGVPALNFAVQTPGNINDVRHILELQRNGQLEDLH
jgi:DDE superfamily endonuclease